jgi:hypothetical protein
LLSDGTNTAVVQPNDRYEPLPGLAQLPAWIWRRMGRGSRLVAGLALAAVVAFGVAVVPEIQQSKEERSRAEQRERAERRAELVRRLEAEQRPRQRRSESVAAPGAGEDLRLAARARLLRELSAAVLADARLRVRRGEFERAVRRVDCEPFPRTVEGVGADEDLSRRRGRYSCVAVTAELEGTSRGVIGHQYRVLVDFETGRYAFCKVSGQAGPSREQLVTTPRACGGR